MNKKEIELIIEDWHYDCGDGCCSDWGTSLMCQTDEDNTLKTITDNINFEETSTLLTGILEVVFPNMPVTVDTIWIPELKPKQVEEFLIQFENYNSVITHKQGSFFSLSKVLFDSTLNITEYIIPNTKDSHHYIVLVFNNEYAYSKEMIENSNSLTEIDEAIEILKYLNIEVTLTEE